MKNLLKNGPYDFVKKYVTHKTYKYFWELNQKITVAQCSNKYFSISSDWKSELKNIEITQFLNASKYNDKENATFRLNWIEAT